MFKEQIRMMLGFLGGLVLRCLYLTLDVHIHGHRPDRPGVIGFWHGEQLCLYGGLPSLDSVALVSQSRDGQIQKGVLRSFGVSAVRGSSSKGGVRALFGLIRSVRRGGVALVALDGPRGPMCVPKNGAFYLAKKLSLPIWPVAGRCSNAWLLSRTWDQLLIPKPFSRVDVIFGSPIEKTPHDTERELRDRFIIAMSRLRVNTES